MNPDPRIAAPRIEAPAVDDRLDFLELLEVLWRKKWSILFWVVLFMVLGGYYAFKMTTPRYTATTVIALENSDATIVAFESVAPELSADYWSIQTEVEVLQSRNLLGKVVDKLALIADPEFNPHLKDPNAEPGLVSKVLIEVLGPVEPAPPPPAEVARNDTIDRLRLAIRATNIRNTRVYHISVLTEDPKKSALIADTLADLYILNQLEAKFEATQQATTWLTDRVAELKNELEDAESAVKAFNTDTDLVSSETLEGLNRQLKDFRDRAADLAQLETTLAARVENLKAARADGDPIVMAEAANDTPLSQLAKRVAGAGGDAFRESFDQRFTQIIERAEFELERNRQQQTAVARSVQDIERQVTEQSADLLKLEQLQREAEASRVIYEYFLGRLKETSVQQGIQQADSLILSNAVVPKYPSSPRKMLIILVMAIFGLIIGIVVVSLGQMRKRDFRSTDDLERLTGITVLGRIPRDSAAKPRRLLKHLISKPTSALAEAVRDLRTSVLLSNVDHEPQIIMLVSSVPGEGKTTQSVALAETLAGMRKRVLLIEGDLRRRTLDRYFGADEGRPGIVSVVAGRAELADAIHSDKDSGIDVLLGERTKINAADFFSSDRFQSTLHQLRQNYDVILIDTPPVLVVPDARLIAQYADAVLYVVRWGSTLRNVVRQGLAALASVNVKTTGLVLSQIDPGQAERYGEYFAVYGKKYYNR